MYAMPWMCVKTGLLCAAGPVVLALVFVSVWSLIVPELSWTANRYQPWNATYGERLGYTLSLLLIEVPFAIVLGARLHYRGVTSSWVAGWTGAKAAAWITIPFLAGLGCLSILGSLGPN